MPQLGIHALALVASPTSEGLSEAIRAARRLGYGLIELPLVEPRGVDARLLRESLQRAKIAASVSVALPRGCHMPWRPERARSWLGRALEAAEAIGATVITGALAYAPFTFSGEPVTLAERFVVAEVLQDLGDVAQRRGIRLALHPSNRYETYLLNTLAEGLDMVQGVDNDALRLHAHTYHMNLEESRPGAALAEAGHALGYVTIAESHRGLPGTGTVPWESIWQGLAQAGYDGPLVLEAFGSVEPETARRLSLWRGDERAADALAKGGLAFLREGARTIALVEANPALPRPGESSAAGEPRVTDRPVPAKANRV